MVSIEEQLKYFINLKHIKFYSKEDYCIKNIKSLRIMNEYFNINKLPNILIKLIYWSNNNLNNLPLSLKCLFSYNINCNLPPNIIYLCYNYDFYNLPRNIKFIHVTIINESQISKELIDYNFKTYYYIKKMKSIY